MHVYWLRSSLMVEFQVKRRKRFRDTWRKESFWLVPNTPEVHQAGLISFLL